MPISSPKMRKIWTLRTSLAGQICVSSNFFFFLQFNNLNYKFTKYAPNKSAQQIAFMKKKPLSDLRPSATYSDIFPNLEYFSSFDFLLFFYHISSNVKQAADSQYQTLFFLVKFQVVLAHGSNGSIRIGMIQYNFDRNHIGSTSNPNFISLKVDLIQMF
jgi:hypothetical protein